MPDRNKPVRHDATGRIIREWDSERKQCADLEVDYTNAGAQVYIAEQNLRRAEGERDGLMRKRERVEACCSATGNRERKTARMESDQPWSGDLWPHRGDYRYADRAGRYDGYRRRRDGSRRENRKIFRRNRRFYKQ